MSTTSTETDDNEVVENKTPEQDAEAAQADEQAAPAEAPVGTEAVAEEAVEVVEDAPVEDVTEPETPVKAPDTLADITKDTGDLVERAAAAGWSGVKALSGELFKRGKKYAIEQLDDVTGKDEKK